jgi:hypothetical protein
MKIDSILAELRKSEHELWPKATAEDVAVTSRRLASRCPIPTASSSPSLATELTCLDKK